MYRILILLYHLQCINLTLLLLVVKLLTSNICWIPSISQYYFILDMYNISGGAYRYICCAELVRVLSMQCDESTCVVLAWDRVDSNIVLHRIFIYRHDVQHEHCYRVTVLGYILVSEATGQ
jgi:hypothetical protein